MVYEEAGMIRCDISAYNTLLVDPKVHYLGSGGWNEPVKGYLGNFVWNCTASEPLKWPISPSEIKDSIQSPREKYVDELKRGAMSVCSDSEFSIKKGQPLDRAHRDRTGTSAFISAQLLSDPSAGQPGVPRTFVHDVESLLWVLIWVVAHHSPSKMNDFAKEMIQGLSQYSLRGLGEFKHNTINLYAHLENKTRRFNNNWANALAPVIEELATFLSLFLYTMKEPTSKKQRKNPVVVTAFQEHLRFTRMTRWEIFTHLLGIFNGTILELEQKPELKLDPARL